MRLLFNSILILLLFALLASVFFLPKVTPSISFALLTMSLGLSIFLVIHKHWKAYQQAECTREKTIRNLALDLLGLLITMGAAMYVVTKEKNRLSRSIMGAAFGNALRLSTELIAGVADDLA